MDDCLDAMKETGSKPSLIDRLESFIAALRATGDKPSFLKWFKSRYKGEAVVETPEGAPKFQDVIRQTMSYGLMIFGLGLIIAILYIMFRTM
jgi:hypothetical protein